jgi:hypothetical protein
MKEFTAETQRTAEIAEKNRRDERDQKANQLLDVSFPFLSSLWFFSAISAVLCVSAVNLFFHNCTDPWWLTSHSLDGC